MIAIAYELNDDVSKRVVKLRFHDKFNWVCAVYNVRIL
jgi:hypothetical protein